MWFSEFTLYRSHNLKIILINRIEWFEEFGKESKLSIKPIHYF